MRAVLAMGLLIALCGIVEAAPARRAHQHVIVRPNQSYVRPNPSLPTPPTGGLGAPGLDPGRAWAGA
jgi:hypothetical protein